MAYGLRLSMKHLMALMLPVALVVGSTSAQIFAGLNLDVSTQTCPTSAPKTIACYCTLLYSVQCA